MINEFISRRYGYWSSAMRREMMEAIIKAEKEIEAKHFDPEFRKKLKEATLVMEQTPLEA